MYIPHYTEYFRQHFWLFKPGLKFKEKRLKLKMIQVLLKFAHRWFGTVHIRFSPLYLQKMTSVACDMYIIKISFIINDIFKK